MNARWKWILSLKQRRKVCWNFFGGKIFVFSIFFVLFRKQKRWFRCSVFKQGEDFFCIIIIFIRNIFKAPFGANGVASPRPKFELGSRKTVAFMQFNAQVSFKGQVWKSQTSFFLLFVLFLCSNFKIFIRLEMFLLRRRIPRL